MPSLILSPMCADLPNRREDLSDMTLLALFPREHPLPKSRRINALA